MQKIQYKCPPKIKYTVSQQVYFQPLGFADLLTSDEMKEAAYNVVEHGQINRRIDLDTNWGCSFSVDDPSQVDRIVQEIESQMRSAIQLKHAPSTVINVSKGENRILPAGNRGDYIGERKGGFS